MRVEGENGYLGTGDAEVAFQALVHKHHLVEKQIVSECIGHVFKGKVVGHDADTDAVAHHKHQARATKLVGQVLGVSREVEVGSLNIALVDWGGDQHIDLASLEVGTGAI